MKKTQKRCVASERGFRFHQDTKREPGGNDRPSPSFRGETLLSTQEVIDALITRIERAYRLRRPEWHGGCSSSRIWAAVASGLIEASAADPSLPVDPELFVASQSLASSFPDPWSELTGVESICRFRDRVEWIVRGLRKELTDEVRVAETRIASGQSISKVLGSGSRRISPLARYIVASRASRQHLTLRFLEDAQSQHQSCPLYRQASMNLISVEHYPVREGKEVWIGTLVKKGTVSRAKALWN